MNEKSVFVSSFTNFLDQEENDFVAIFVAKLTNFQVQLKHVAMYVA